MPVSPSEGANFVRRIVWPNPTRVCQKYQKLSETSFSDIFWHSLTFLTFSDISDIFWHFWHQNLTSDLTSDYWSCFSRSPTAKVSTCQWMKFASLNDMLTPWLSENDWSMPNNLTSDLMSYSDVRNVRKCQKCHFLTFSKFQIRLHLIRLIRIVQLLGWTIGYKAYRGYSAYRAYIAYRGRHLKVPPLFQYLQVTVFFDCMYNSIISYICTWVYLTLHINTSFIILGD